MYQSPEEIVHAVMTERTWSGELSSSDQSLSLSNGNLTWTGGGKIGEMVLEMHRKYYPEGVHNVGATRMGLVIAMEEQRLKVMELKFLASLEGSEECSADSAGWQAVGATGQSGSSMASVNVAEADMNFTQTQPGGWLEEQVLDMFTMSETEGIADVAQTGVSKDGDGSKMEEEVTGSKSADEASSTR
jgi:hypothetical protein